MLPASCTRSGDSLYALWEGRWCFDGDCVAPGQSLLWSGGGSTVLKVVLELGGFGWHLLTQYGSASPEKYVGERYVELEH